METKTVTVSDSHRVGLVRVDMDGVTAWVWPPHEMGKFKTEYLKRRGAAFRVTGPYLRYWRGEDGDARD